LNTDLLNFGKGDSGGIGDNLDEAGLPGWTDANQVSAEKKALKYRFCIVKFVLA